MTVNKQLSAATVQIRKPTTLSPTEVVSEYSLSILALHNTALKSPIIMRAVCVCVCMIRVAEKRCFALYHTEQNTGDMLA